MSTVQLRTYGAAEVFESGVRSVFGTLNAPIGEVSFTGQGTVYRPSYPVLTRNTIAIFTGTAGQRFQFLGFRIIGDGTLWIGEQHDKPTDAANDDYTPTGAQTRWHFRQWTCEMGVCCWNTDLAIGHATAASEYADNSGNPALWTTYLSAVITKKLYQVQLFNPSTTDPVLVESLLVLTE